MNRALIIFLFISIFIPQSVWGQTRCPIGTQMGSMQCIPDTPEVQNQQAAPAEPTGEWIKTWGAIASSESSGEVGTAANKFSEDEAKSSATRQCALGGSVDCIINLVYQNQCAAFASSSVGTFFQASPTEERAMKLALRFCEKNHGLDCKIAYSECTKPVFRKY
ncbi:hypothetical protein XaplCFBP3122_18950 [Xanthomonas arboricola pv. populi]|uniref:DUF4189 domain-containing protein n=1 Tax=Xanthomonas arboricola pv. populi TaxID=487823 RepID=A0A2S6Z024_9XANT|nr:DUF4189 domain-containing protein [Xanthomonas arboricola]PPT73861.1 hypothetical protein XaplCFBP3122_18950 [Xanthomonas arboricola pv. populi]